MIIFNIKVKFSIIVISFGLVFFVIAMVIFAEFTEREFEKRDTEKAELIWAHVSHDLGQDTGPSHPGMILDTLNVYRNVQKIPEARMFNIKGEEIFFRQKGPAEPRIQEVLKTGRAVHFAKKTETEHLYTFIFPIENKPLCQTCHGRNELVRGALLLSLPLGDRERKIAAHNRKNYILFATFSIGMVGVVTLTFNRLYLRRLRRIERGTEAISQGDFKCQIPVEAHDEIGNLAKHFNHMAGTLDSFFREIEDKNRQLSEQIKLVSHSQREWQETFDSITDQVCVIDRQFNIVRANRTFREYFSLDGQEPINQKCHQLIGTCLGTNCPHMSNIRSQAPVISELPDAKTDKVLQVSLFPYYLPDGDLAGSIYIAKDITEKKENEMRLIMNERLASLGQVASGIAHELGNPLATIAGCAEALLKRIKKESYNPSLFANYLTMIEQEISRCKNITTEMLSFVRSSAHTVGSVNVQEALDKTLEMIEIQGRLREVEVVKNYGERGAAVRANEADLRQVFLTILVNALDAMEDKGTLTLETGVREDKVFIKIQDSGPGIPSDVIGRIFDPFFTTKSDQGGTGLGLSIADKIIRENNGKIDVASQEGTGAVLTVSLPLSSI